MKKLFLLLSACLMTKLSANINFEMPKMYKHDWNVDAEGNAGYWAEFGKMKVAGHKWPIRVHFDSGDALQSPYVGVGWQIPLIESRAVKLDRKKLIVTLPCGRDFWFYSRGGDGNYRCLTESKWSGKTEGNQFVMSSGDWELVYLKGRIQSMKTSAEKKDHAVWKYKDGRVVAIQSLGKDVLTLKKVGENKLQLFEVATKSHVTIETSPVSQFGSLFADKRLNSKGRILTKITYLDAVKGGETFLAPEYNALDVKHELTGKVVKAASLLVCNEPELKDKPAQPRLHDDDRYTYVSWDRQSKLIIRRYVMHSSDRKLFTMKKGEFVFPEKKPDNMGFDPGRPAIVRPMKGDYMIVTPMKGLNGRPKIYIVEHMLYPEKGWLKSFQRYFHHNVDKNIITVADRRLNNTGGFNNTPLFYKELHDVYITYKYPRKSGILYDKVKRIERIDYAKITPDGLILTPQSNKIMHRKNFFNEKGELVAHWDTRYKYIKIGWQKKRKTGRHQANDKVIQRLYKEIDEWGSKPENSDEYQSACDSFYRYFGDEALYVKKFNL